jgi:hypothetical protein
MGSAKIMPIQGGFMASVPLSREVLGKFGSGDQLHVFHPEDGSRHIGTISRIRLEDDSAELFIDFSSAMLVSEDGMLERAEIGFYTTSLGQLFVSRDEPGYLEVPNVPAEQVLLFIKPTHQAFVSYMLS